jgi:plasmid stability protein
MADVLVRNLDDAVLKRLKTHARREGRSLQAEVSRILTRAAETPQVDPETARKMLDRFRRRFHGRRFSDSAAILREDRDR